MLFSIRLHATHMSYIVSAMLALKKKTLTVTEFMWLRYHNVAMDKAASQTSRPQVRVFFGARDLDVPHPLPRLVEAFVDRINAGVMRTYAVSASGRYTMVLCELLVQRHVQLQMSYILVEMRLLVIPHVGKPRKSKSKFPINSKHFYGIHLRESRNKKAASQSTWKYFLYLSSSTLTATINCDREAQ